MSTPDRVRIIARPAFVLYTLALTTATHWPGVTIEGPVPRPDVWVHIGAFSLWAALLVCTRWLGPAGARSAVLAAGAGLAWGAIDELTQPIFNRHAAWSDWAADAAGSALGATLATLILVRVANTRTRQPKP